MKIKTNRGRHILLALLILSMFATDIAMGDLRYGILGVAVTSFIGAVLLRSL